MSTANEANELYLQHAGPTTVPQGNLLSDISPRTMLRAARIMLAKSTLPRKLLPVKLDLDPYRSEEFRYDTGYAEEVQKLLEDVPLNKERVRWIHEDVAVNFYGERFLDVPYDEFVARVDISRVGDCFRLDEGDRVGAREDRCRRRAHAGAPGCAPICCRSPMSRRASCGTPRTRPLASLPCSASPPRRRSG
jgi:hypothetical protein